MRQMMVGMGVGEYENGMRATGAESSCALLAPPRERHRSHTNRSWFDIGGISVLLGAKNGIFHVGILHEIRWVLFGV